MKNSPDAFDQKLVLWVYPSFTELSKHLSYTKAYSLLCKIIPDSTDLFLDLFLECLLQEAVQHTGKVLDVFLL